MNENYSINKLITADVHSVVTLIRSSFEETYLIPSIYRGSGIENFILKELENPCSPYLYFTVSCNDHVIAFSEYKITSGSSMVFWNLVAIDNEYKNQGIGRMLFLYCRQYFIEKGYGSIQLDVYKTNAIALNWYERFGFRQINSSVMCELETKEILPQENEVYIQNFSQYKALLDAFGFSYIEAMISGQSIKFGIIGNDIFIKGNFESGTLNQIVHLKKTLNIENAYFIGNTVHENLKPIEIIFRMELNIKL